MNYILTGAGFTVNWGGWTADRLLSNLLSIKAIKNNADLRLFLSQTKSQNFESILDELRKLVESDPKQWKEKYRIFESSIIEAFKEMEKDYAKAQFSYNYDVENLFAQCDVIFTLNQDLLLERYFINLARQCFHPGVKPRGHPQAFYSASYQSMSNSYMGGDETQIYDENRLRSFDIPYKNSTSIPYIKLHGSINWRDQSSGNLMIMGTNKEDHISQHDLTKKYFEIFDKALNAPNSHLLIIGYSFSDKHINKIIFEAILNSGLKLFIWGTKEYAELKIYLEKKIHELNPEYEEKRDIILSLAGVLTEKISELIKDHQTSDKIKRITKQVFI
jgi:hypothetical protein